MARDFSVTTDETQTFAVMREAALREVSDTAGSIATNATVAIGDTFTGTLSTGDSDWVAVDLVAGETYVFTAYGTGGSAGVRDTRLILRDSSGAQLDINFDVEPSAGNYASMISFTPTTSGTYYLDVAAEFGETGQYTLRTSTNVFTIEQVGSQLTDMGWGFADSALQFGITAPSTLTYNLTGLTAEGRELARMALETWSVYTGIAFIETTAAGAAITFDDFDPSLGDALYAFAGPLDVNQATGIYSRASVTVSTAWLDSFGTTYGSYSYLTYLHEIGHALGLGHGGFYDGSASFGIDNHYLNDSYQMTIMSYFDMVSNTFIDATAFRPITPMAGDLAGIQSLYGTAANVFVGDTVWGANSNIAGYLGTAMDVMFDGAARPGWMTPSETFGFTIMDSVGRDTMDFSRTGAAQVIDMRAGGISDVYGMVGTVVVALGTVIENAIGGSGQDTIHGNAAANNIVANGGNDMVMGYGGNDVISGGTGNDTLFGGAGNDVAFSGIGDDSLNGGDGQDALWGGAGADVLMGGSGDDTLGAAAGSDEVYGGLGRDTIWGGIDNDYLDGGADDDEVAAGLGVDTLYGGDGNDTMFAGGGDDVAFGGMGDDFIWGMAGNDVIRGGEGNDTIAAGPGSDALYGELGADTFIFYGNGGENRIMDFNGAEGDRLNLSRSTWISTFGNLTPEQIENTFGSLDTDGNVTLTLGTSGTTIILVGVTDLETLDQYISIIA